MAEPADLPEPPPREPEIELLGKLARIGLFAIRVAMFVAGTAALAYGLTKSLTSGDGWEWLSLEWRARPSAAGAVWLTVGLPLVLPANVLLDRGLPQAALLGLSAVMWFMPWTLGDDSEYGYILRLFATLVAFLCLVVWRTLWRLTTPSLPTPEDAQTM